MTRRWQLILGDDLVAYASKGKEHADADETVVIAIGTDLRHLEIRELDLTAAHAGELRQILDPYLRAGHDPEDSPVPPGAATPRDVLPDRPGQGKRREVPGTREFLLRMREFGAQTGIPASQTKGKSGKVNYKYSKELYAAFLAHLHQRSAAGDLEAGVLLVTARKLGLDGAQDAGSPVAGNGAAEPAVTRL